MKGETREVGIGGPGLGHHLGLEAHDPGGDSVVLEPGMVITNEPGFYIPGESLGIRIEDDYLVTAEGAENLSAGLPVRPEEVEAMMRPQTSGL